MKHLVLSITFLAASAYAQDAGQAAMQAAQQANDAAMQASQQANDAAMQASQQANAAAMQNAIDAANSGPSSAPAPKFSIKSGSYPATQRVYITDAARHAAIYYTVDGWTPTDRSERYSGPVVITSSTSLQAIAVVPGYMRSFVSEARYALPGTAQPSPINVPPDGVLRQGIRVPHVFAAQLNSESAVVGQPITLVSAVAFEVAGRRISPGGVSARGVVTEVKRRGLAGRPGSITFSVDSLNVAGVNVPLHAVETLEGRWRMVNHGVLLIPIVGMADQIARRGDAAEIRAGASLTANVTADTQLR